MANEDGAYTESFSGMRYVVNMIGRYPILSHEEQMEQIRRYNKGTPEESKKALDAMVNSNLRLVLNIAKKQHQLFKCHYRRNGTPLVDLFDEGIEGLMIAIKKFDVDRGFRFSTYASWWIRQGITRYIMNNERTVRVPIYMQELYYKAGKFTESYNLKHGTLPSDEELYDYLNDKNNEKSNGNISLEKVREIRKLFIFSKHFSLDDCVDPNSEESATYLDQYPDEKVLDSETSVVENDRCELIIDNLQKMLDPREYEIICRRYGFSDNGTHLEPESLESIGNDFGVTRERIRQIEDKALRKLRHSSRIKEFEWLL
ncbi:MAG: RNA polymerase sigma factor RpoD/SigA [archaeon]